LVRKIVTAAEPVGDDFCLTPENLGQFRQALLQEQDVTVFIHLLQMAATLHEKGLITLSDQLGRLVPGGLDRIALEEQARKAAKPTESSPADGLPVPAARVGLRKR